MQDPSTWLSLTMAEIWCLRRTKVCRLILGISIHFISHCHSFLSIPAEVLGLPMNVSTTWRFRLPSWLPSPSDFVKATIEPTSKCPTTHLFLVNLKKSQFLLFSLNRLILHNLVIFCYAGIYLQCRSDTFPWGFWHLRSSGGSKCMVDLWQCGRCNLFSRFAHNKAESTIHRKWFCHGNTFTSNHMNIGIQVDFKRCAKHYVKQLNFKVDKLIQINTLTAFWYLLLVGCCIGDSIRFVGPYPWKTDSPIQDSSFFEGLPLRILMIRKFFCPNFVCIIKVEVL